MVFLIHTELRCKVNHTSDLLFPRRLQLNTARQRLQPLLNNSAPGFIPLSEVPLSVHVYCDSVEGYRIINHVSCVCNTPDTCGFQNSAAASFSTPLRCYGVGLGSFFYRRFGTAYRSYFREINDINTFFNSIFGRACDLCANITNYLHFFTMFLSF